MHKKSASLIGKIDFFGVLHHLVVSLGSGLELDWVLLLPELSKVILNLPDSWSSLGQDIGYVVFF